MTELVKLWQTGGVVEFQEVFDRAMTRLNLDPNHAISIFLNGLKPELGDAVRIHRPFSLPQAYYLARLQESIFLKQSKAMRSSTVYPSTSSRANSFTPSYTNVKNLTNPAMHLPKPAEDKGRRRRLTPA